MKLEGYDMADPQAREGLEMNPEAYRITAGGPVGTGTGYKRLKNHYPPGLGTFQGVDTVVKLDFGRLYPYSRVIPCGTGKQNHILPPDGPGNGYLHFAVGKTVGIKNLHPVDSLSKRGAIRFFDEMSDYPGSIIPHGFGSGDDEFMHVSLHRYGILYLHFRIASASTPSLYKEYMINYSKIRSAAHARAVYRGGN
jgi:hypothetical protein